MPKTYYDSELTGAQIEQALEAIDGLITPSNNEKVLCIEAGKIVAKSASTWTGGYPEPTGTIPITANGMVNVKDYETAEVNVPSSITAADEGKVVKNGALVAQTARATDITANGTYDTTENNSVTVNVSGGGGGGYFNGELITLLTLDQGSRWIDTGYDVSNVTDFLFFKYLSGQTDVYAPVYKAKSDIAVYTGGADVYTNIFTVTRPFNVRIYNNTLWVSFNGTGSNTNGALSYTGGNFASFMSTVQQS